MPSDVLRKIWMLSLAFASGILLAAWISAPPTEAELVNVTGVVEQVTPMRIGSARSLRPVTAIDYRTADGATGRAYLPDELLRAHEAAPVDDSILRALKGQTVEFRLTSKLRVSRGAHIYAISRDGQSIVSVRPGDGQQRRLIVWGLALGLVMAGAGVVMPLFRNDRRHHDSVAA
jgi:hypothetical protein